MVESRRRPRLPSKTFQGLRVSRQFLGQELQGDEAAQFGVLSFVDNAHPAATKLLDDAVVRNGLVNHSKMPWPSGRFILRTRQRPVNEWGHRPPDSRESQMDSPPVALPPH